MKYKYIISFLLKLLGYPQVQLMLIFYIDKLYQSQTQGKDLFQQPV